MYPEQALKETEAGQEEGPLNIEPFSANLSKHDLELSRGRTSTLQVNVGYLCNQTCRHCHLSAGPGRREIMKPEIIEEVVSYSARGGFGVIDITGGAPEMNPNLSTLIEKLSPLVPRVILRSNLSALNKGEMNHLMNTLKEHQVVIFASFPSINEAQADAQRGEGIFQTSITTLQRLNSLGYGQDGAGLELNLVSNPTGAFLPPSQAQTEKRFRQVLQRKWGIVFNTLFNFANVPLGRFRQWLMLSGNLETYLQKLVSGFNPCATEGLMCRTLVSVSWDGYLYDCDFNLARGLYMDGRKIHITDMAGPPEPGSPITVADHCYTCTAGAGFT